MVHHGRHGSKLRVHFPLARLSSIGVTGKLPDSSTSPTTPSSLSLSVLPHPRVEPEAELPPSSALTGKSRQGTTTPSTHPHPHLDHLPPLLACQTPRRGIGSAPRRRRCLGEMPPPTQAPATNTDYPRCCATTSGASFTPLHRALVEDAAHDANSAEPRALPLPCRRAVIAVFFPVPLCPSV